MQVVSDRFNELASSSIRPLSWGLFMSFTKEYDEDTKFFILDESLLDGPDLLMPDGENVIQQWDYYKYLDYTSRVGVMEWTREIEFPSSVTLAMADFSLNNYDQYFSPNSLSPISEYILPKRPVRIMSGFGRERIPQFVGLTDKMPEIQDRVASFHAIDFLSRIFDLELTETIAANNIRTDEVLALIFQQLGLNEEQYELAIGSNTVPFLFFDKGSKTGTVIRKLMEAEMGNLWLDEKGVIRFMPRLLPNETKVYDFDKSNVSSIEMTSDDNIINSVTIRADIRKVQAFQPIYLKTTNENEEEEYKIKVSAGGTRMHYVNLEDPCLTVTEPELTTIPLQTSWFTAKKYDNTPVSSNVTISYEQLFSNTYVITFSNSNAFSVIIDQLEVWGEPAKVVDNIEYTEKKEDSIEKYEEHKLVIENEFIQSIEQARDLALTTLFYFSENANTIEMEVKGNPAIQLGDVIDVDVDFSVGNYKITKIINKLIDGKYTQIIKAIKYELRGWFYLSSDTEDMSLLDGPDLLA